MLAFNAAYENLINTFILLELISSLPVMRTPSIPDMVVVMGGDAGWPK